MAGQSQCAGWGEVFYHGEVCQGKFPEGETQVLFSGERGAGPIKWQALPMGTMGSRELPVVDSPLVDLPVTATSVLVTLAFTHACYMSTVLQWHLAPQALLRSPSPGQLCFLVPPHCCGTPVSSGPGRLPLAERVPLPNTWEDSSLLRVGFICSAWLSERPGM